MSGRVRWALMVVALLAVSLAIWLESFLLFLVAEIAASLLLTALLLRWLARWTPVEGHDPEARQAQARLWSAKTGDTSGGSG